MISQLYFTNEESFLLQWKVFFSFRSPIGLTTKIKQQNLFKNIWRTCLFDPGIVKCCQMVYEESLRQSLNLLKNGLSKVLHSVRFFSRWDGLLALITHNFADQPETSDVVICLALLKTYYLTTNFENLLEIQLYESLKYDNTATSSKSQLSRGSCKLAFKEDILHNFKWFQVTWSKTSRFFLSKNVKNYTPFKINEKYKDSLWRK